MIDPRRRPELPKVAKSNLLATTTSKNANNRLGRVWTLSRCTQIPRPTDQWDIKANQTNPADVALARLPEAKKATPSSQRKTATAAPRSVGKNRRDADKTSRYLSRSLFLFKAPATAAATKRASVVCRQRACAYIFVCFVYAMQSRNMEKNLADEGYLVAVPAKKKHSGGGAAANESKGGDVKAIDRCARWAT